MENRAMSTEEWVEFVKLCKLLKTLPQEKQKEIYYMSEGAKIVARSA